MGRQRPLRWLLMTGRREAHTRVIWTTCFSPGLAAALEQPGGAPGPPCPGRSPALCPQTLGCVSLTFHGSKWTLLLVGPLKAQVPCHTGTSPFSSHQPCGAAVYALGPPLQPQPRLQTRHPPGPQARVAHRQSWQEMLLMGPRPLPEAPVVRLQPVLTPVAQGA